MPTTTTYQRHGVIRQTLLCVLAAAMIWAVTACEPGTPGKVQDALTDTASAPTTVPVPEACERYADAVVAAAEAEAAYDAAEAAYDDAAGVSLDSFEEIAWARQDRWEELYYYEIDAREAGCDMGEDTTTTTTKRPTTTTKRPATTTTTTTLGCGDCTAAGYEAALDDLVNAAWTKYNKAQKQVDDLTAKADAMYFDPAVHEDEIEALRQEANALSEKLGTGALRSEAYRLDNLAKGLRQQMGTILGDSYTVHNLFYRLWPTSGVDAACTPALYRSVRYRIGDSWTWDEVGFADIKVIAAGDGSYPNHSNSLCMALAKGQDVWCGTLIDANRLYLPPRGVNERGRGPATERYCSHKLHTDSWDNPLYYGRTRREIMVVWAAAYELRNETAHAVTVTGGRLRRALDQYAAMD